MAGRAHPPFPPHLPNANFIKTDTKLTATQCASRHDLIFGKGKGVNVPVRPTFADQRVCVCCQLSFRQQKRSHNRHGGRKHQRYWIHRWEEMVWEGDVQAGDEGKDFILFKDERVGLPVLCTGHRGSALHRLGPAQHWQRGSLRRQEDQRVDPEKRNDHNHWHWH